PPRSCARAPAYHRTRPQPVKQLSLRFPELAIHRVRESPRSPGSRAPIPASLHAPTKRRRSAVSQIFECFGTLLLTAIRESFPYREKKKESDKSPADCPRRISR